MPDPANEPTSTSPLRRALEEGTRQLPDRVRQLPGFAVRTAVTGVGKLLTVTAKAREEYVEMRRSGVRPTLERVRDDGLALLRQGIDTATAARQAKSPAPPAAGANSTAPVKDVERASAPSTDDDVPADAVRPVSGQEAPHLPEQFAAAPVEDELPLPNYDELTLGSIRARLRNLTIGDLGTLLAYERGHQNRPQVVTMYENRILKLEKEQGA